MALIKPSQSGQIFDDMTAIFMINATGIGRRGDSAGTGTAGKRERFRLSLENTK